MCSRACNGGQASATLPSARYSAATFRWASTMFRMPSANCPASCVSGRRIASSNTFDGLSKMRPKYVRTNPCVIR